MGLVPWAGYLRANRRAQPDPLTLEGFHLDRLRQTSEGLSVPRAGLRADHRASPTGMGILFAGHHLIAQAVNPGGDHPIRRLRPRIAALEIQVGWRSQSLGPGTLSRCVRASRGRFLD